MDAAIKHYPDRIGIWAWGTARGGRHSGFISEHIVAAAKDQLALVS